MNIIQGFLLSLIDAALDLSETLSDLFVKIVTLHLFDITFGEIGYVFGLIIIVIGASITIWGVSDLLFGESKDITNTRKLTVFLFWSLPVLITAFTLIAAFLLNFVFNAGPRLGEFARSFKENQESHLSKKRQNHNPANKIDEESIASLSVGLGLYYDAAFKRKDYETAYKFALKHAEEERGAKSQFHLGWMYEMGQGVEQDYKEAFKWYHRSAVQGDFKGQLYLGKMYERGQGTPQDYKEAARLFRISAEQKYDKAQFKMGSIFEEGVVVSQNLKEAVKWYVLSAEQGFAPAKIKLYELAKKNLPQAVEFLRYDADIGITEAQRTLGEIYSQGLMLPANYSEAHMWFSIAILRGNKNVITDRNELEKKMSPSQIEEAQELARNWRPDRVKIFWEQFKDHFEEYL
jgi:uncharacterized protein